MSTDAFQGRRVRRQLVTAAVVSVAVAVRAISLHQSPLPFITDGFVYAGLARDTIASAGIPLSRMATDEIVFSLLLTAVAQITGVPPLYIAQPMSVLLGALPTLLVVAVVKRFGRRWEWSELQTLIAVIVGGSVIAVNGGYLQRSFATDEQTMGLFVVPVLAFATTLAIYYRDWRWGVLAVGTFLVLPPLHNLTGLVGTLTVTVILLWAVVDSADLVPVVVLVGFVGLGWGYLIGYHVLVEQVSGATIVQEGRLVRAPGLFLAWIVLASLGVLWLRTKSGRAQQSVGLFVFGTPFVLLVADTVRSVHPSAGEMPPLTTALLLPLVVSAVFAAVAVSWLGQSDEMGAATVGLLAAPVVIGGFSLSAGVTFEYLHFLIRSHLFVYFPFAVLVAIGAVRYGGWQRRRRPVVGLVVAVLVVSTVVSAPVAFLGPETRVITGTTTPAEFQGVAFATERVEGEWATDGHLARVAGYFSESATTGPVLSWARGGAEVVCPVLAKGSWSRTGVQAAPLPSVSVSDDRYDSWRQMGSVVYSGGDSTALVVPSEVGSRGACRGQLREQSD